MLHIWESGGFGDGEGKEGSKVERTLSLLHERHGLFNITVRTSSRCRYRSTRRRGTKES